MPASLTMLDLQTKSAPVADSPLKCSYADVPVMKPSRLAEETLHAPRCAPWPGAHGPGQTHTQPLTSTCLRQRLQDVL